MECKIEPGPAYQETDFCVSTWNSSVAELYKCGMGTSEVDHSVILQVF